MVGTLTDFEKIEILLHEYDGLRNEIVQRWLGMQQQISVGCLVLMGVVTVLFTTERLKYPQTYVLYALLGLAFLIFIYAMYLGGRDTFKAASRAREIEHEVNERAGEELIRWETYWGGGTMGIWGAAKPTKYRTPPFQRPKEMPQNPLQPQ